MKKKVEKVVAPLSVLILQKTFEPEFDPYSICVKLNYMGGSRGVTEARIPLENHKNIGFLSNTGPDPLKKHKATKPAFNFWPLSARQRNTI